MKIGMADAAKKDFDLNILFAGIAPVEGKKAERRVRALGGKTSTNKHGYLSR
jgi:hypothetical protein